MEAFHTPKTSLSPILSGGTVGEKTGAISSVWLSIWSTTGDVIEAKQPWLFSRIWIKIKALFTSETAQNSGVVLLWTENLFSWVDITWSELITWTNISGHILSWLVTSWIDSDQWVNNEDLWTTETMIDADASDIQIQKPTTKTTITVKKPSTTKTTTKQTTTEKDPILDALFK